MADEQSVFLRLAAAGQRPRRVTLRGAGDAGSSTGMCGRYEVLGKLAEGGIGEVWRGRDADIGRDVALKVLRPGRSLDPELMQRFVDEAQISGQLQHPGVVPVYELGLRADRRPYIAMKLVKGKTLAAMLREKGVRRHRLLQVFEQVCRTMAYAHERGVIHRDLKPSNVMVGAFGETQVLDWGFAKVLPRGGVADERERPEADLTRIATQRSSEGSESMAGSILGTPAYMPPEQALGAVDDLDERSDVFSLGAILCEILTGKPPYTGERRDVLMRAAQADLDDAYERLDACESDRDLAALARRCLAPLRADRPANAGELGDAVLEHLAAREERAHRAEVAAAKTAADAERAHLEAREQRRARRQSVVLAAVMVIALVGGGAGFLWFDGERRARLRRAEDAVNETLTAVQTHLGDEAWPEASAAAERAAALARDGDEALRARAAAAGAQVSREKRAAERRAAQREREEDFLAAIDEARVRHGDDYGTDEKTDAAFAALFARHGVEVESAERVVATIEENWRRIAPQLAGVLDEWSWLRHELGKDASVLIGAARWLDPHPWRNRLRDALAAPDRGALLALRDEAQEREDLSPRTLDLLAVALYSIDERDAAIALARRAWRAAPDDFPITIHLAGWLATVGDIGCLRFCEAAVALRPRSPFAWHTLGHAYGLRGDDARAEEAFEQAMRLAPRTAEHPMCFASELSRRGSYERAIRMAREAVKLDPENPRVRSVLGTTLLKMGKAEDAVAAFRDAIRLEPEYADTRVRLAQALRDKGDLDGALAAAREAVRLAPHLSTGHHTLGYVLWNRGELDAAAAEFREAVRTDPKAAWSWSMLGSVLGQLRDQDGAIDAAREAIRLDPDKTEFHVNLSAVLLDKKDWDGAVAAARDALRLAPKEPNAITNLAIGLAGRGEFDEAIARFRESIRIRPDHPVAHYALGNVYMYQLGEMEKAVEAFDDTIRVAPEYAEAYCNKAHALRQLGRFTESLASLRKGHAIGSRRADWRYPSANWIRDGILYAQIEGNLQEIVAKDPPPDPDRCATIGWVLVTKKRFADAARFYAATLDGRKERTVEDLYLCAGVAVRAATPSWRERAQAWLREVLDRLARAPTWNRVSLAELKKNPALAPVRDRIDELPEAERDGWRRFWADVDALLARAVAK